uniref:ARAD1A12606p n=1 Tax=Blastobotrys adeninivorans TaxID=409370 RepID=A0A060T3W7_BLAAD
MTSMSYDPDTHLFNPMDSSWSYSQNYGYGYDHYESYGVVDYSLSGPIAPPPATTASMAPMISAVHAPPMTMELQPKSEPISVKQEPIIKQESVPTSSTPATSTTSAGPAPSQSPRSMSGSGQVASSVPSSLELSPSTPSAPTPSPISSTLASQSYYWARASCPEIPSYTQKLRYQFAPDNGSANKLRRSSSTASTATCSASAVAKGSRSCPGPIPASTPMLVRRDEAGVDWISFEYTKNRVKTSYCMRCDVESVDVNALDAQFKADNCIYKRACVPPEQYTGNRQRYESECNYIGWALSYLNPVLRGRRGLIQRAVDSWRNTNADPSFRSRRVRRLSRKSNRSSTQVVSPPTLHQPPQSQAPTSTPHSQPAPPTTTPYSYTPAVQFTNPFTTPGYM